MAPDPTTPRKKRQQSYDSDGSFNEDESPTKKLKFLERKVKQENSNGLQMRNAPAKKQTRTPQKIKREVKREVTNDATDDNTSPTKTPSKTAQKKAEAAQRKQWKEGWRNYLIENQWKKDPDYTQQPGNDIHKTEAKKFYGLNDHELGLLPYVEFENENNPDFPGRSYSELAVKRLAYRKLATLAGKRKEGQIDLEAGEKLFDEYRAKRTQRNPYSPKKPQTIRISEKRPMIPIVMPIVMRSLAFQRDMDYQFDDRYGYDSDGSFNDYAPFA